jgi:hypothetical protein
VFGGIFAKQDTMAQSDVDNYYQNQASGYYSGPMVQRGHGLGGLFSSLFRTIAPMIAPVLKSGAKAVAREALRTGTQIASDYISGDKISAATRTSEAAKRLARRAVRSDPIRRIIKDDKRTRPKRRRKPVILD